jgi:hypothetical protein
MASLKTKMLVKGDGKKRKRDVEDAEIIHIPPTNLEVDSDGEGSVSSDDGDAEPFPELDSGSSDTSSGEEKEDEEDEEGSADDTEETDVDEQDGPYEEPPLDGKTVISNITGRPKRVYPEIVPEYDSDSSTEEVRKPGLFSLPLMPRGRTPIESGIFQCTGMTTSLISATISTGRKCFDPREETSSTNSWRPQRTLAHGAVHA